MNSTFEHAQSSISSKTIYIFWSHTQSEIYARRNNAGNWSPNHFVPLLLPSNESQYQNSMTEPKATGSGLTPTKSTTKNNILTQVRIPEFNAEDDETQQFQMSSTLSTVNQEIATTPRTKRRLQVTENYTNVENTNMDRRRQKARESMAAKRAQATPEEAGRQRTLARERSAARRATITPEQAERERTLARERSAARRAALTPEQTERERSLDRQRKAARRAAITPEQTERERSLDRQRKAARRAALTPDEIVQQRAITREKTEAWRATFSSKEIEYQRVLAAEKSMSKRATASPKEAEEQRVVARKRSAARRAAYTFDELEPTTLPLDLDDLCDSLKIIFVGCRPPQRNQLKNVLTVRKKKVFEALQWLRQNNPLYRNVTINQSIINKLPDDDVPECLWATMEISTNVEAAENERASYIPDPLINASEFNNRTAIPIISR
ncbi:unnamed protein product [Rotaria sp. Silwood1]|nr:unnamed protein product [Rotaria sp. Silwood1]